MKKFILLALFSCIFIGIKAQEYEMVVQKTDGTEKVFSYNDIASMNFYDEGIYIHPNSIASYVIDIKFSQISKIYFKTYSDLNNVNSETIVLYPNPATATIRIIGAENKRVEIYSMDGKMIYNGINNGNAINIASFEKGIYVVKIDGKTFKFSKL